MNPTPLVRKFSWRVFGVVFAGIMGVALLYTVSQPRLYQSVARLQFDRPATKPSASPDIDYEKQLDFAEVSASAGDTSKVLTHEVAERLAKSEDIQAFLKPYGYPPDASAAVIEKILSQNLKTVVHPEPEIIEIIYRHPDPEIAVKLANELGHRWAFQGAGRQRIDSEMHAMKYEYRQKELQRSLVQADVSLLGLYGDGREDLSRRLKDDQAILASLTKNLERSIGGLSRGAYFEVHVPPASADRYPLHPLVRNLAWGLVGAAIIGAVAGLIFKRPTRVEAPFLDQKGTLRVKLLFPIRSHDVIVFALVFLAAATLAVYQVCKQPRIYQSSVTLAVSENAHDYGWDDLRTSDFASWLPVITQRVAMRLSDTNGEPALMKSYGFEGGADLAAITSVLRHNLTTVFHAETGTMHLYYRHSDPQSAALVAERFGHEYEMYAHYQERNDTGNLQKRMDRYSRAFERVKPKIELQIQRAEDAKRALQSYQEANASLSIDELMARAEYRERKQKQEEERTALIHLRYEMENFALQTDGELSPVAVIKKSGWAPANQYLLKPIIVNLGWGFLGAITAGMLSVLAFRMIPSFSHDHSEPSRKE